jgi:uncharacterized protein YndB with AHSA1/START domain
MSENTGIIEREIFIGAPPEAVFRYLVEPNLMMRWIGLSHEIEPQPGGRFRVEVSKGNIALGVYTEVAPPRRIVFTWGWESQDGSLAALPPGASLVEIDLEPKEGGTFLRLRHSRLPADLAARHGERWSIYLAKLQARAAIGSIAS